jgi:hypothetical protein
MEPAQTLAAPFGRGEAFTLIGRKSELLRPQGTKTQNY